MERKSEEEEGNVKVSFLNDFIQLFVLSDDIDLNYILKNQIFLNQNEFKKSELQKSLK